MIQRSFRLRISVLGLLGIVLIAASSCKEKKKTGFTVTATYTNADKLSLADGPVTKAYLLEVTYGRDQAPVILDSVKLNGTHGQFTLGGNVKGQEVYELAFGNGAILVPLVNDAAEVKVNVDLAKKDDFYEVTGSEASGQLKQLINIFGKKNYEVDRTMADLDSAKRANAPDSLMILATNRKNDAIQDLNTYLKQFINTSSNATLCGLALGWSSRSFTKAEFESSLNDLVKKFPENIMLRGIKQSYEQQLAQMQQQQAQSDTGGVSWIGKQAPELSLPDINGKTVKLSSFRGKYVLLDFWASWCGPCREENPNVVQAYNAFRNKNFTVVGVSLDRDKDAWKKAIEADGLTWTHISDLKFWSSEAVGIYGFNGIPFNVLIDPKGQVIGEKLRGDELQSKLKEVLR